MKREIKEFYNEIADEYFKERKYAFGSSHLSTTTSHRSPIFAAGSL
ncbi:hypothetical protein HY450_01970 [Candidatus Pacearchaeota archaeon]|nr:hypothetical protein [Candidatus Pacearchaeota archaeon]